MILYTTMPQELIFQTPSSKFAMQEIIQYDGIPLLVERDENHCYRIIQIMSTDPGHFLDSRCAPGTVLTKKPF
nr:YlzJ-like family protein [uncultured Bacillus sp.]